MQPPTEQPRPIGVMCVDDNEMIAEALERALRRAGGFEFRGRLLRADALVESALRHKPDVVLLDIDMPGADPFEALRRLASVLPSARVIMCSGHVRRDLIDRAVDAGAWGYVSKDEETAAIINAIRRVAAGEFTLGPEAAAEYGRR